jgi:hypothetical protein
MLKSRQWSYKKSIFIPNSLQNVSPKSHALYLKPLMKPIIRKQKRKYYFDFLHIIPKPLEPIPPIHLQVELNDIAEQSSISIHFTQPLEADIINYLYSLDWKEFVRFDPRQNTSPVKITHLDNGETYIIRLKSENKYGYLSNSSEPVSVFVGYLGFPE